MTRLQWIILVGLTAISVVTAIALGTVFAKQKELSDHNHGAPECCTCKEMKNTATGAGSSLDEFFERNPSLGRNDCEDDACAKGYTRESMPNLVQDSQYGTCMTTATMVTRTKSVVTTRPSTSTKAGTASSITKTTSTSEDRKFMSSVTYSARVLSTAPEVPSGKITSLPSSIAPYPANPVTTISLLGNQHPVPSVLAHSLNERPSSTRNGEASSTSDDMNRTSGSPTATSKLGADSTSVHVGVVVLPDSESTDSPSNEITFSVTTGSDQTSTGSPNSSATASISNNQGSNTTDSRGKSPDLNAPQTLLD
ncbi:hypothetical protein PGQ11_005886 [Apiospora arundinis]|uniref:Uncharacterized protein n=1 Tax=Apiospora arundinis TaxID=335852 RepID=A0ABR2IS39_9PEZI